MAFAGATGCVDDADPSDPEDCNICGTEAASAANPATSPSSASNTGNKGGHGKLASLQLEYTGTNALIHSQPASKVSVAGDPASAAAVTITAGADGTHGKGGGASSSPVIATGVNVGDVVTIALSKFPASFQVTVATSTGILLSTVVFHTSCSQPLAVGNVFGSVKVVSGTVASSISVRVDKLSRAVPNASNTETPPHEARVKRAIMFVVMLGVVGAVLLAAHSNTKQKNCITGAATDSTTVEEETTALVYSTTNHHQQLVRSTNCVKRYGTNDFVSGDPIPLLM